MIKYPTKKKYFFPQDNICPRYNIIFNKNFTKSLGEIS